jgi:uroporphyrinogen-III synthase
MPQTLTSRVIAVPETRALDLFCDMLEQRGATAMRCPMVRIRDASDKAPVEAWLDRFVLDPPQIMIFYTGEGLMRLVGFAERMGCDERFVAALSIVRKVTRGPKPVKALRSIGLDTNLRAVRPTTDGLVETLQSEDFDGQRVGVQLYPDHKAQPLLDLLDKAGASIDPVTPYRYIPAKESTEAAHLIERMGQAAVDLIAITSMAQVNHLFDVAVALGLEDALAEGLAQTDVASVGPVATEALQARGYKPTIVAPEPFALKSLVRAIEAHFAS